MGVPPSPASTTETADRGRISAPGILPRGLSRRAQGKGPGVRSVGPQGSSTLSRTGIAEAGRSTGRRCGCGTGGLADPARRACGYVAGLVGSTIRVGLAGSVDVAKLKLGDVAAPVRPALRAARTHPEEERGAQSDTPTDPQPLDSRHVSTSSRSGSTVGSETVERKATRCARRSASRFAVSLKSTEFLQPQRTSRPPASVDGGPRLIRNESVAGSIPDRVIDGRSEPVDAKRSGDRTRSRRSRLRCSKPRAVRGAEAQEPGLLLGRYAGDIR